MLNLWDLLGNFDIFLKWMRINIIKKKINSANVEWDFDVMLRNKKAEKKSRKKRKRDGGEKWGCRLIHSFCKRSYLLIWEKLLKKIVDNWVNIYRWRSCGLPYYGSTVICKIPCRNRHHQRWRRDDRASRHGDEEGCQCKDLCLFI